MHLTDEQFEDALQGVRPHAEHLAACEDCRRELGERGALRSRLQKSFASVTVPQALAYRIAEQVGGATEAHQQAPRGQDVAAATTRPSRLVFRWPAMAAAAAILIVAVTAGFVIWLPQPANAAQVQLVRIHQANLSGQSRMFASSEPGQLEEYLRSHMKDSIPIVDPSRGGKLQGCCVARFKGKEAASYLVRTGQGAVSIIVLDESPQALGMKQSTSPDGLAFWSAIAGNCNMAAAKCPCGHMFYAVGEVPTDTLVKVLAEVRANCCGK
jgi:hypothetical protein